MSHDSSTCNWLIHMWHVTHVHVLRLIYMWHVTSSHVGCIYLHITTSSYLLQVPTLEFLDTDTGETVCLSQSMAIMVFLESAFPTSGLPLLGYFSFFLSLSLSLSHSSRHSLSTTLSLTLTVTSLSLFLPLSFLSLSLSLSLTLTLSLSRSLSLSLSRSSSLSVGLPVSILRDMTHSHGKCLIRESPCCPSIASATRCNTLQHTETHCITLQHTATHCNTL